MPENVPDPRGAWWFFAEVYCPSNISPSLGYRWACSLASALALRCAIQREDYQDQCHSHEDYDPYCAYDSEHVVASLTARTASFVE